MDKIEDRWLQYDTIQSEVYDALPTDRQEEATALMEQTDDVRSRIVVLRNFEKKKRGREWLQIFPTAAGLYKNLGVVEAETKLIIGPAIISALPDEAVARWSDLPDAEITDPKAVMKFLDELIKSAERHERTQTGRTKQKSKPQPSDQPTGSCSQLATSVTTKPKGKQASKPEATKKRYPCPYDGEDHAAWSCTSLSVDKRLELVAREKRCS